MSESLSRQITIYRLFLACCAISALPLSGTWSFAVSGCVTAQPHLDPQLSADPLFRTLPLTRPGARFTADIDSDQRPPARRNGNNWGIPGMREVNTIEEAARRQQMQAPRTGRKAF
jgi:hypothetical protein